MKKIFLVTVIFGLGFTSIKAQNTPATKAPEKKTETSTQAKAPAASVEAPALVKEKFVKDYPAIKNETWTKKGSTAFLATFEKEGRKTVVEYRANGEWVETYAEADQAALPVRIHEYMEKNYKGDKIKSAHYITEDSKSWYEIVVGTKMLNFDPQGNIWAPEKKAGTTPAAKPAGK